MADAIPTAHVFVRRDMAEPEVVDLAGGRVGVLSRRAPDRASPSTNEDALAVVPLTERSGLILVADGVGGAKAGGRASETAANELAEFVRESHRPDTDLRDAVLAGLDHVNACVLALGGGAATTLAVVTIEDDVIRSYHVGDSEVLVTGQRGRLKFRTVPHSPVGYAVEAGVVDADEALHHEDRHLISNAVGSAEMSVAVGAPIALARFDSVLAGSDGLFDNLFLDEIVELTRKGPLEDAVRALDVAATQRMAKPEEGQPSKCDDLTIVLYRRR